MMNENIVNERVKLIETRLKAALNPNMLRIEDESAEHAGHAGARQSGGGHFHVTLVSSLFEGKGLLARHRLVYNALEGLIGPEIHALQIVAKTPLEYGA
jgi:BolA protein